MGGTFLDVLLRALKDEERELKEIQQWNPHLCMSSISFYYERWVQYIAIRHAIRMVPNCPRLWVENNWVDVSFVDGSEQEIATFELKGPARIENGRLAPQVLRAIERDFDRQLAQARKRPEVAHFVVLLLYGQPGESERWRRDGLCSRLADSLQEMTLKWKFASEPIVLNRADHHTEMILVAARVEVGGSDVAHSA